MSSHQAIEDWQEGQPPLDSFRAWFVKTATGKECYAMVDQDDPTRFLDVIAMANGEGTVPLPDITSYRPTTPEECAPITKELCERLREMCPQADE